MGKHALFVTPYEEIQQFKVIDRDQVNDGSYKAHTRNDDIRERDILSNNHDNYQNLDPSFLPSALWGLEMVSKSAVRHRVYCLELVHCHNVPCNIPLQAHKLWIATHHGGKSKSLR